MKRNAFILLMIYFLISCAPGQIVPTISMDKANLSGKQWNVAILDLNYEFENEGKIGITHYVSAGKDGGRVVAGLLAAELAKLENVNIIERGQVTKLIDEQAFQQTGAIDPESAIEIGKLVGAEAVLIGDLPITIYGVQLEPPVHQFHFQCG
ncbi:hypothetical protein JW960_18920 [candidate division KSB1 bacterium]|nr:hypothetical protein [candidate division KSB1 bacterium]